VRWHRLTLDAAGLDSLEALAASFLESLQPLTADARDRLHAVRVTLEGESALHRVEAAQPGALAAALHAAAQDAEGVEVWVERVRIELRSPTDRAGAALRPDAIGEVVRLVDELLADDAALAAWAGRPLRELGGLPPGLLDADPSRLDAAALRAALADAEGSVLAQLSQVAATPALAPTPAPAAGGAPA
jgi:exonuclease SbcD